MDRLDTGAEYSIIDYYGGSHIKYVPGSNEKPSLGKHTRNQTGARFTLQFSI